MQKIDSSGAMLWGNNGRPLVRREGYQTSPTMVPGFEEGFMAAWMDDRGDASYNIYLQRINSVGNHAYAGGGMQITRGTEHQRFPVLKKNDMGEAILIWSDERYGRKHSKLYGVDFDPVKGHQGPSGGFRISSTPGRQTQPKLRILPNRDLLVTWLDQRNQAKKGFELYCQRLKWPHYKPVWRGLGVKLGEYLQDKNPYSGMLNGQNAYFAWTQQIREGKPKLFWCLLDLKTGEAYSHRVVNSREVPQWQPMLFSLRRGKAAVIWKEKLEKSGSRLLMKPLQQESEAN
jgi:hypothetical protein